MVGEGKGDGVKVDRWGYSVRTSSDACISSINSYYQQVLTHGRKQSVILEAPIHDEDCVLANTLAAAYFVSSGNPSRTLFHLSSAQYRLKDATSYEKTVFDAISSLIAKDRDDVAAVDSHSKVEHSGGGNLALEISDQITMPELVSPEPEAGTERRSSGNVG
ncbi:hypothetical protein BVC80_1635g2 [Macleaya cordata]|uniref:Uncharacterized protein n=1 Tax=Macleaya cordata TaxID=56857 RepID=A0A200Q6Q0_MACCD|nr:hypothetical protein BVC80_1635g2 [Macleaya cordata]